MVFRHVVGRSRQSAQFALYTIVCTLWAFVSFILSSSLHSLVVSICVFYFLAFCFELWAAVIAVALADSSSAEPPIGSRFSYSTSRFIVVAGYAISVFVAFSALSIVVESIHSIFHSTSAPSWNSAGILFVMVILYHTYRTMEARHSAIARLPPIAAFRPTVAIARSTSSSFPSGSPNPRLHRISFPLIGLSLVLLSMMIANGTASSIPQLSAVSRNLINPNLLRRAGVQSVDDVIPTLLPPVHEPGHASSSHHGHVGHEEHHQVEAVLKDAEEIDVHDAVASESGEHAAEGGHPHAHAHTWSFYNPSFLVDMIGGLLLAIFGLSIAIPTLRGTGGLLVQRFPSEVAPSILKALSEVAIVQGVVEVPYSDLHVWAMTPGQIVMSAVVVIAPDCDAQHVRTCVRKILSPFVHTLTLALTPARRPAWTLRAHESDLVDDSGGLLLHVRR